MSQTQEQEELSATGTVEQVIEPYERDRYAIGARPHIDHDVDIVVVDTRDEVSLWEKLRNVKRWLDNDPGWSPDGVIEIELPHGEVREAEEVRVVVDADADGGFRAEEVDDGE